ncbi:MAG: hypothetical protein FD126_2999 [Elusimicrobia bacterium]|nr:MAG: hypothetical protein FD126_2999 [Elusimicrobiota bacterium]
MSGMTRRHRNWLVVLNCASILALLAGFLSSSKAKTCEEARTRQVFFAQHEATAATVTMLMTPKKTDAKTGDYDDALYDVTERARRNRERFLKHLDDGSCTPFDRSSQLALCLSAALQIASGLLSALWNKA